MADLRLEPFLAIDLQTFRRAGVTTWQAGLAVYALRSLGFGDILGIVDFDRAAQLKTAYLAVAAPIQPFADEAGSTLALDYFNSATQPVPPDQQPPGRTTRFERATGDSASWVTVSTEVLLGRKTEGPSDLPPRIILTHEVLAHELTHTRNQVRTDELSARPDDDFMLFADPDLSLQQFQLTGTHTGAELRLFAEEMSARHVAWIVTHERRGDFFGLQFVQPGPLVAAAHEMAATTRLFRANFYLDTLISNEPVRPDLVFNQLAMWFDATATLEFSSINLHNAQAKQLFADAASFARDQAINPSRPLPPADGIYPLRKDFLP